MIAVSDNKFMDAVRDARDNGFDVVCVECGTGVSFDGMDIHEPGCTHDGVAAVVTT